RPLSRSLALVVCLSLLVAEGRASADAASEGAARALQKKAADDYLATDFKKALDKLRQAIARCGSDKCGDRLRARLRRDMGTVLVAGLKDRENGTLAFAEARSIDPTVQLDPDTKTKEVEAAWAAAKSVGSGVTTGPGTPTTPSVGELVHTPPEEQTQKTPLPL